MFLWNFIADKVLGGIIDWIYEKIIEALGEFFGLMGNMGAEIFNYDWVKAIVEIMRLFGWALFAVGIVVAVFETAIEYQNGRGSIKDTALNFIKGFMAVSLFTLVPISLYQFCITLQVELTTGMSTIVGTSSIGETAKVSMGFVTDMKIGAIMAIFILIAMGFAVIKIFFANLKRGGILLITIAVGSLYMFSVPRGYTDGFIQWCKQIIGICLTAFLQAVILIAGLGVMKENCLLGIGLILSASEIPRIAGQFGLDTSTKANIMSTIYAAQAAMSITKTVAGAVK
ncbi:conjugal transfer protein TrbL family protein [Anaerorhabdus sp.]|uniref:conjugal transfer protein TrbL family protein n=1 Tax=Anaerorhabdus sp. TaxID=1872524 RepID=UPI002FC5BEDF